MRHFLALVLLIPTVFASYCGKSGVPFSVEVLQNGAPVLGCAQPLCVAHPEDDLDDSLFQTDVDGQPDGFFRDGDRTQNSYLQANKMRANCSGEFNELACTKKNQWVGGIEYIDHPRQPLVLQCCSFEGLRFSQDVGVTTISAGEAVTGGEVIRDGRQISFDVIANVRKVVDPLDHSISYEVTVRRMNCLPDPPEVEVSYDNDIAEEITRVLGTAGNGTMHQERFVKPEIQHKKPRRKHPKKSSTTGEAFGAPIFNPVEAPREEDFTKNVQQVLEEEQPKPHPRIISTRPPKVIATTTKPATTTTPVPTTTAAPSTLAPSTLMTFGTLPTLPPFQFPTVAPHPPHQVGLGNAGLGQAPGFGQGLQQNVFGQPPGFVHHAGFGAHGLGQGLGLGQPQQALFNPFQHHHDLFGQHQAFPPAPMAPATIPQFGQTNLFQLPQHHFPQPQPFGGLGQPFGPLSQGAQNTLYGFGNMPAPAFGQQVQAGAGGLARPLSGQLPGFEEHPEVISPVMDGPQTNNQLPDLFTPPPFLSLSDTLNNFRTQG